MLGVQMSMKPRSSIVRRIARDHRVVQPEVALHALGAHVEPAVAEAQDLVDVLLVELERERLGAGDDPQRVHLHLDLAGRQVRVDGLGRRAGRPRPPPGARTRCGSRARPRPPPGARSGLRTSCTLPVWSRRSTKTRPPWSRRVSAQPASVTRRPASAAVQSAAGRVAPGAHPVSLSSRSPRGTSTSCSPRRRSTTVSEPRITVSRAPERCAWVSWPFSERPA